MNNKLIHRKQRNIVLQKATETVKNNVKLYKTRKKVVPIFVNHRYNKIEYVKFIKKGESCEKI